MCKRWNDSDIGIVWPLAEHGIEQPQLSEKDARALPLAQAELA